MTDTVQASKLNTNTFRCGFGFRKKNYAASCVSGSGTLLEIRQFCCRDRGHWRLLLEQRSCGYTWSGAGHVDPPPLSHLDTPPPPEPPAAAAEGRSRLAGLKQMSVEKIASIRQRLAEGRKLLRYTLPIEIEI
jgi:hypothetical protein